MDNKEQLDNSPAGEGTSAASGANRPGVIASTSDVVVPPTDAEVSAAASKLAPARKFFGHRPDFSQPSAPAETGDIIIANTKPPTSSRTKLIIGAVTAITIAVVCIMAIILLKPKTSAEISAAYEVYRNLLENGPQTSSSENNDEDNESDQGNEETGGEDDADDVDADTDAEYILEEETSPSEEDLEDSADEALEESGEDVEESGEADNDDETVYEENEYDENTSEYEKWYFFRLSSSDDSYEEKRLYVDDLTSAYKTYLGVVRRADKKVAHREEIQEISAQYETKLELLSLWVMSSANNDHMTDIFVKKQDDAAIFINKIIPGEFTDESAENIRQMFERDLRYQLEVLRKYESKNCIDADELNLDCQLEVDQEEATAQLIEQQNDNYEELSRLIQDLQEEFFTDTESLESLIGGSNAE